MDTPGRLGTQSPTIRRLRRLIPEPSRPHESQPSASGIVRSLIHEIRLKQWIKNFACLAGLIFSEVDCCGSADIQATLGFFAFCFASSSVYILNDIVDREKDRQNPRTARGPSPRASCRSASRSRPSSF